MAAEAGCLPGSGYHKAKARKPIKNWMDLNGMELTWEEVQQLTVNRGEWHQKFGQVFL